MLGSFKCHFYHYPQPHLYVVYKIYATGRTELLAKQFHTNALPVLVSFHLLQTRPQEIILTI